MKKNDLHSLGIRLAQLQIKYEEWMDEEIELLNNRISYDVIRYSIIYHDADIII